MTTPAEQLKGLSLENGWTVVDFATRRPNATGGHFSHGYVAVHEDGRRGFLKAMDYTRAMLHPETFRVLNAMSSAFLFEKQLCEKCVHLSRVTHAIDSGFVHVDPKNPFYKVEYLIFELADGDVRAHLDIQEKLDNVFVFKTLHHVATGLSQLHQGNMAHQDLKPSNVLVYGSTGARICDLGRGWDKSAAGPHDTLAVAGDTNYAPLDQLYGLVSPDHRTRRFGCDMYHLGSLVAFLFSRAQWSALVVGNLSAEHRPLCWADDYQQVLPFVYAAFDMALDMLDEHTPAFCSGELRKCVSELCCPDPNRRGHPLNRGLNQFGLERYISCFDRLAHRARLELV